MRFFNSVPGQEYTLNLSAAAMLMTSTVIEFNHLKDIKIFSTFSRFQVSVAETHLKQPFNAGAT